MIKQNFLRDILDMCTRGTHHKNTTGLNAQPLLRGDRVALLGCKGHFAATI